MFARGRRRLQQFVFFSTTSKTFAMNENIGYNDFAMFQGNICINIPIYLIDNGTIIMLMQ